MVEVTAHHIAVIREQDIPELEALPPPVGDLRLDGVGESADKHRQAAADGNGVAVSVEEADGEVFGLVNDRTVGGAHEVRLHLAGDGDDGVPDDFRGERIYCGACLNARHHAPLTSRTRCPKRFISAESSGPSTVT